MENLQNVLIQSIYKPARKVLIKRGISAKDYMTYCEEVGCEIWEQLVAMESLCGEPVCLWLPKKYIKSGTSTYVQGVEVPTDYNGAIPEGFDLIELPAANYLMFQSEPYAEENFTDAIDVIWNAIYNYNPALLGYEWDDEIPRIQLAPISSRGYIELRAVKKQQNA